jgi:hypothetical protein
VPASHLFGGRRIFLRTDEPFGFWLRVRPGPLREDDREGENDRGHPVQNKRREP